MDTTDKRVLTIGEAIPLDTGLFAQQYANWKRRAPTDREWGDFEPFWTCELNLWHKTTRTAVQTGHTRNINEHTNKDEYENAEQAYYDSL